MTLKEIKKNFPFSGTDGACKFCAYIGQCDKILPGLIKPNKCGGPFYKFDDAGYEDGDEELKGITQWMPMPELPNVSELRHI